MGSRYQHVVMVPYPAQSHVAPLMQLASLLHGRGAHVTLVHTRSNYRRLVDAKGEAAVRPSSPGFRVEVIHDGLPLSVQHHDVAGVVRALRRNCRGPFRALLGKLPPVTCVVADTVMTFAATVAREAGVPDVGFFTASACGLMGYSRYGELIKRGLVPLPLQADASCLATAMATPLPWVPGMPHMRLKDMPSFCHTTDPDDPMVAATLEQMQTALGSKAIVLNTVYELEKDVVDGLAAVFPPLYTVGPLAEVAGGGGVVGGMDISIWQEDADCLAWLDKHKASSVVYVNFGSMHVMAAAQLREFALGLASCGSPFLWVKRPDVVDGEEEEEGAEEVLAAVARGAGLVVPWCAQPAVLKHPAVGLFVTHCGWNSLLEAAAAGQPVLCWPLYAEQSTNCRQVCECWGNGAELPGEKGVEHGVVSALVREMMEGELGREKRAQAAHWKAAVEMATTEGGSSRRSLDRLVEHVLLPPASLAHATTTAQ